MIFDAALSRSKQAIEYLAPPMGYLSFGSGLG